MLIKINKHKLFFNCSRIY